MDKEPGSGWVHRRGGGGNVFRKKRTRGETRKAMRPKGEQGRERSRNCELGRKGVKSVAPNY